MKPVLWTTRKLVTSVSVVARRNQALTVQYSATRADIAASDRKSSTGTSAVIVRDSTRNTMATSQASNRRQVEHPVRVGGIQHLLAGLQDFVDITPHTPVLN